MYLYINVTLLVLHTAGICIVLLWANSLESIKVLRANNHQPYQKSLRFDVLFKLCKSWLATDHVTVCL